MKKCPFCAEEIQDAAIVCKHCGRELKGANVGAVTVQAKSKRPGCLPIILILGAAFIGLIVFLNVFAWIMQRVNPPSAQPSAPVVQSRSANDLLTEYDEQRRGAALRNTVIGSRGNCDRANRTFYKGTIAQGDANPVALWAVGCVNGLNYLVQITPNDAQLIAQYRYAYEHRVPVESVPGYTRPNQIEALAPYTKTSVTDCAAYRKLSGGDCFTKFVASSPSAGQRIPEEPLRCGGPGYTATYSAGTKDVPPMVDVTFRGTGPNSAVADTALRKCIKLAADTMSITNELMGTVWFGRSKDDDSPVALPDGSDHLTYDPKTKEVRTWNEREGTTPTIAQASGYFVQYKEEKIFVKPGGKFASISVVFAKQPSEKVAYETVIAEVLKAIDRTRRMMSTSAYAQLGSQSDPASWRQIKGANGKYISARFDPRSPKRITTVSGDDLGPAVR